MSSWRYSALDAQPKMELSPQSRAHGSSFCYSEMAREQALDRAQERRQVTLSLTILRCPDAVAPETRQLRGGEFSLGRGAENDWVLPDPERYLSKRHCVLAYRSGGWQIADLSTNGTFLNGEAEPIGRGQPRDLRDRDRLRLGTYEIEVRIAETAAPRHSPAGRGDPFALDPFLPPAGAGRGFGPDPLLQNKPERGNPFGEGFGGSSISLPADYDPLAPHPAEAPFIGPTQSDHSPHLEDAIRPAVPHSLLPDDWDAEPSQVSAVGPRVSASLQPAPVQPAHLSEPTRPPVS